MEAYGHILVKAFTQRADGPGLEAVLVSYKALHDQVMKQLTGLMGGGGSTVPLLLFEEELFPSPVPNMPAPSLSAVCNRPSVGIHTALVFIRTFINMPESIFL